MVVLDYGSGNVHSAVKALERVGAQVTLTADRTSVLAADGLLVPGVGAFAAVVSQLESVRGGELIGRRLAGSRPVLGICVGMQVLFERGVERGEAVDGLGEWPGTVRALRADIVPHMGWDTVEAAPESVLFSGIEDERFYFVHSYAATEMPIDANPRRRPPRITWAEHGERFIAAVENGPLSATQFHPEKSGDAGLTLLENWVRSL